MCHKTAIEPKLSVLMSIYSGDNSDYLDVAIKSIVTQTRPPDEIVLVEDGRIPQRLNYVVEKWRKKHPGLFRIVRLPNNVGLGFALKAGLENCSYEIVARMDADDISCPTRFKKQLKFLHDNPDVTFVSSWMACFEDNPDNIVFIRRMPQNQEDICRIARFRNPVCHPPAMFRRSAVEAVGGYVNWRRNQDYHLWARMLLNGSKITCIPEPLYKFRYNSNFLERRSSFQHMISMIELQKEFLKMGFISFPQFLFNIIVRIVSGILPLAMIRVIRMKLRL